MVDVSRALTALAAERPVFHCEADFQHALGWKIRQLCPDHQIRLEFKPPHLPKRTYVDIWVTGQHRTAAIEVKYKTRRLKTTIGGETFDLPNHHAQNVNRCSFLEDVQRLEKVVSSHRGVVGYAIFLTNDRTYWNPPTKDQVRDVAFRLHEGRVLEGELRWAAGTAKGTMEGHAHAITLNGSYRLGWRDYSELSEDNPGKFRYLIVQVGN